MLPLLLEERPAACGELVPLTVEQYHRMISAGILEEGEPIELLDGMLVTKDRGPGITVHPLHSLVVTKLLLLATRLTALGCHLRSQTALTIRPRHEPEPDAAIMTSCCRTDGSSRSRRPICCPDRDPGRHRQRPLAPAASE